MSTSTSVGALALVSIILLFSVLFPVERRSELNAAVSPATPVRITGTENHFITLNEAVRLTSKYRENSPEGAVLAETFGRDAVAAVLAHPRCAGLKIYYGMKDEGTRVLVLIGVDGEGIDLADGAIAENGFLCPPFCDNSVFIGQPF